MCCPCSVCENKKEFRKRETLWNHLALNGFMSNYSLWTKHGEVGVMMEDNEEDDDGDNNLPDWAWVHETGSFQDEPMDEGEANVEQEEPPDELGQALLDARKDSDTVKEALKFEKMLEDHKRPLFPNCKPEQKKLGTTLEMLKWKASNGVTDKGFGELLKIVKNMLPEGNELPSTTYEAKKMVCPLGLDVQKIHACLNDCILYRGEYENLEACPVCSALRYKIRRDDPGDVDGEPVKKRVPAKLVWYFPIIPRLKRFFKNKDNAKLIRWHKEDRKEDHMIRHPADGSQWRNLNREYPQFDNDPRNIRFALSADGMNPYGEFGSAHSTWPVTLCMFNLPPWLCLKRKFIMMPVLIEGPKEPGNDIDVFLQPLMDDLLLLWKEEGVHVWDEYKQESFNLRALLFVCINDWPALAKLSGQSNMGYMACTHCYDETDSIYLKHCKKCVYMGHRRFLPTDHPLRTEGKHFKGESETRRKPLFRNGKRVFSMIKDVKVVFGKGPGSQPVPKDDQGHVPMWKKKSILWNLPYWQVLQRDKGRHYLKPASYNLSKEEKEIMFDCLNSIKVPSGYSSNIQGIINVKEKKIQNLKSHDCHVLMTQLLPVILRGVLPENYVRKRSRPEGCIAKGYGTEEVIEFCVDYLPDLNSIGLPVSHHEGRLKGKGTLGKKCNVHIPCSEFSQANFTVLQNSSKVAPYIDEHMNIIQSENPQKNLSWITRQHIKTFDGWFRRKLLGNNTVDQELQWLARGPSITVQQYQGYEINGYTFYTRAQDKKSTNQNSGVRMCIVNSNGEKNNYYGVIEEIWELEYGPIVVPLFRCEWVAGGGVTKDRYGMTIVDFKKIGYKDEPFVLAKDVTQVFYVKDMSSKPKKKSDKTSEADKAGNEPKRHIVLPGKRKVVGVEDISDNSEDYDQIDDLPPFSVDVDPSILLSKEDTPYLRCDHAQGTFVK
ncbi:uncharacterized protein LOC112879670, partial [Panicum hallii]|uniref:uncharacterized protein LOC112879670 n=1 Tax=Panicum hallii TaxID=206008 RepID=UPI000DF4EB15